MRSSSTRILGDYTAVHWSLPPKISNDSKTEKTLWFWNFHSFQAPNALKTHETLNLWWRLFDDAYSRTLKRSQVSCPKEVKELWLHSFASTFCIVTKNESLIGSIHDGGNFVYNFSTKPRQILFKGQKFLSCSAMLLVQLKRSKTWMHHRFFENSSSSRWLTSGKGGLTGRSQGRIFFSKILKPPNYLRGVGDRSSSRWLTSGRGGSIGRSEGEASA